MDPHNLVVCFRYKLLASLVDILPPNLTAIYTHLTSLSAISIFLSTHISPHSHQYLYLLYSPITHLNLIYIHLTNIQPLFMSLLFPSYTSHPSLINIHIRLSQFSLSFTLLLSPFYPSHPSVSNIYICFIFTKIPVTDIHKPVSQLSQIFILLLFPSHPYELSISNIHFLCLTHISANCEEY